MCAGATSIPALSVGRITWESVDRPSASTSAIERSTVFRLIPSPAVRLAWGSISMQRMRRPSSARAPARLIAVVVFPTPPFWLAIAITLVTRTSPRIIDRARRAVQGGWGGDVVMLPQPTSRGQAGYPHGSRVVHHFGG